MVKDSHSAYLFFLGCICERTFHSTVLETGSWEHLFEQVILLSKNNSMNETWLFQTASKPRAGNLVKFGWWIPSHHCEICHFKKYHAHAFFGIASEKKKKERAVTKVNQLVLIVKFFIYQYYFICRFDEGKHKVWKSCTTYLLDQDYNSGCLFKTEGPTLAISVRNSNGSEELFSKRLKSDFYSKYEKSQLLWQF